MSSRSEPRPKPDTGWPAPSQQGSDGRVLSFTDSPGFPHMPSFPDQLVLPWLESQPQTWQGQEPLKYPCGLCCPQSILNLSLSGIQPQCKRLGVCVCVCVCWGVGCISCRHSCTPKEASFLGISRAVPQRHIPPWGGFWLHLSPRHV